MPTSVLLTSAGSLVSASVLECLADQRQQISIIGLNSTPDQQAEECFDHWHLVPPLHDPLFAVEFADLVDKYQPSLVIPGRDDDVVALATLADKDPALAARLIAGPSDLALRMRDTAKAAHFAQQFGLPFVETLATGLPGTDVKLAALLQKSPGPWIVKPARGHGSLGVVLLDSALDVRRRSMQPGFVIQPYLGELPSSLGRGQRCGESLIIDVDAGWDYDAQIVLGADSQVLATAGFTSRLIGGKVADVRVHDAPELLSLATTYASVLAAGGWRGPVNIQARCDQTGLWQPFEINPRFTGGTAARRKLGFDEVGMTFTSFLRAG